LRDCRFGERRSENGGGEQLVHWTFLSGLTRQGNAASECDVPAGSVNHGYRKKTTAVPNGTNIMCGLFRRHELSLGADQLLPRSGNSDYRFRRWRGMAIEVRPVDEG
jgi:hypothetical protein